MGSVDQNLARLLQGELGLERAIETGTFLGATTRKLAGIFPSVVTIELSEELHADAERSLSDLANVRALQGHSAERLPKLADPTVPTLYFFDGHWSGGVTEGANDECPLLRELRAIAGGHPSDCILIDDARFHLAAPPPPHDPDAWPTLLEVIDVLRADRPDHHITVLDDQILAVPPRAKAIVDDYGRHLLMQQPQPSRRERITQAVAGLRGGR